VTPCAARPARGRRPCTPCLPICTPSASTALPGRWASTNGDEIIAHHDLAPWNLVIGGRQWAFIDWDTAAPGTRLWDLAHAMHGFAPLSADPAYQRDDAGRRLRLIADAYGLTERQRLDIIPLLGRRAQAMHTFLAEQAARGQPVLHPHFVILSTLSLVETVDDRH
jgi:Ser/Thr protein kinase RdoA (MazF antagonist)